MYYTTYRIHLLLIQSQLSLARASPPTDHRAINQVAGLSLSVVYFYFWETNDRHASPVNLRSATAARCFCGGTRLLILSGTNSTADESICRETNAESRVLSSGLRIVELDGIRNDDKNCTLTSLKVKDIILFFF